MRAGRWECPQRVPSVRIAEILLHTGGCGSFVQPMRVRSGSSGALNVGKLGESIIDIHPLSILKRDYRFHVVDYDVIFDIQNNKLRIIILEGPRKNI